MNINWRYWFILLLKSLYLLRFSFHFSSTCSLRNAVILLEWTQFYVIAPFDNPPLKGITICFMYSEAVLFTHLKILFPWRTESFVPIKSQSEDWSDVSLVQGTCCSYNLGLVPSIPTSTTTVLEDSIHHLLPSGVPTIAFWTYIHTGKKHSCT